MSFFKKKITTEDIMRKMTKEDIRTIINMETQFLGLMAKTSYESLEKLGIISGGQSGTMTITEVDCSEQSYQQKTFYHNYYLTKIGIEVADILLTMEEL